jgi:hypothetical protein
MLNSLLTGLSGFVEASGLTVSPEAAGGLLPKGLVLGLPAQAERIMLIAKTRERIWAVLIFFNGAPPEFD